MTSQSPAIQLLDGGTGRELKRMGAPFEQPEWSALALMQAPQFVSQVHQAYVDAGADVITTNSYAVVPFHIGQQRFEERGEALAALAGQLARKVADAAPAARRVRVAGSLPPVCGSYRADLFDAAAARPILDVLIRGLRPYIDHWQAETLSSIEEAELVRAALGDDDTQPLWLSFTLQDEAVTPGQPVLRSGQSVADAVAAAVRLRAAAVLFNCSQPEVMADALDAASTRLAALQPQGGATQVLTGVYANAFPPQNKDAEANAGLDEIRSDLTPQGYLDWVRQWMAQGAGIVGGCCGIGPEHIAAMRVAIDQATAKKKS